MATVERAIAEGRHKPGNVEDYCTFGRHWCDGIYYQNRGGGQGKITVCLNGATAAGGATVALSSSQPGVLPVPSSIVVPAGYRLGLSVRGKDYEWQKSTGARLSNFKNELRGCGPFLHDDPRDRPAAVFGGRTTLHLGDSFLLLPVIP